MPPITNKERILKYITKNPKSSHRKMAEDLGFSIGTTQWHMKKLILSGEVFVEEAERVWKVNKNKN